MIKHIEARGKQCPMPLILAKKALAQLSAGDTLEVSVDNEIAMENLVKLAVQKQLSYTSEGISEKHYIVRMDVQEAKLTMKEMIWHLKCVKCQVRHLQVIQW